MKQYNSAELQAVLEELSEDVMKHLMEEIEAKKRAGTYGKKYRYGASKDVMWQFLNCGD